MRFLRFFQLLSTFWFASLCAEDLAILCQEVEQKVYNQTLTNPDLYQWAEALYESLGECQKGSSIESPWRDKSVNEFLECYHTYKNTQISYNFVVAYRESHFSWVLTNLYCSYVRAVSACKGFTRDEEFEKLGLKIGQLSKSTIQPFTDSLKRAKTKRFVSEDAYPERYYVPPGYGRGHEGIINTGLTGYELGPEQLAALSPIIQEISPTITSCTGSPWKIVNVLCWETSSDTPQWGMNNWHTDGKPILIRKVMIYLTGAGEKQGTTEFVLPDGTHRIVEGPPGVWVYAKISELMHKGVPPRKGKRLVVELRIVPSLEQDSRPFSAGFHSFYPLVPWFNPFQ